MLPPSIESSTSKERLDNVSFNIEKGQKTVFLSHNPKAMTALFEIINGNREAQAGTYKWGITITTAYLPLDNTSFFQSELNLVDWLSQFALDKCTHKQE